MSAPWTAVRDLTVRKAGRGDSRRPMRALIALAVVAVVLGVAVGGLWWLDHRNSQVEAARDTALQAAREQVVTVLSYDFRSMDQDLQRAREVLTGGYLEEFTTQAKQVTVPAARKEQITTSADVMASAVVRADPAQVVVLLFVTQRTRSSQSEAVRLSAHRLQLTMTRIGDRWLISELERV